MNDHQTAAYLNSTVKTAWEVITPETAAEMLTHNTNNYRAISKQIVSRYVDEIQGGAWEANGDTIVFNENGTLLNGQHRLTAVVDANMPIVSLVVRGVPDSQIFDIGRKRNTRLILNAEGYDYANTTTISAIAVLINGFSRGASPTLGDIREVVKAERELLIESYELSSSGSKQNVTRKASVMAATFCALKMKLSPASKIQQLYKIANTGFPIEGLNSSPGLALRMSLQANSDGKWDADARKYAFDVTIQAIIDYEHGVERKSNYRMTSRSEGLYNVVHQMIVREIAEGEAKVMATA